MANTSAIRVILCLKCSKFNLDLKTAEKTAEKVLVFEITASELVAINCPYQEENTYHRQ